MTYLSPYLQGRIACDNAMHLGKHKFWFNPFPSASIEYAEWDHGFRTAWTQGGARV